MTCIIAYKTDKGCYLGADSLGCAGDIKKENIKTSKIFKTSNNVLIGVSGNIRLNNLIRHNKDLVDSIIKPTEKEIVNKFIPKLIDILKENNYYNKEEDTTSLGGQILIVNKNKIWEIDSFFGVIEWNAKYVSIGSGLEYAYGSLFTTQDMTNLSIEERIKIAIETASKYNMYVGGPIEIINNIKKE